VANRVVVITGASSGIGEYVTYELARRNDNVVIGARRKDRLDEVAARALEMGETEIVPRDAALEEFGRIDVWINNAGRGIVRHVMEITDEDFDEMMLVNVKSALYGMQAVVPQFIRQDAGHLINISSMLGRVPMATMRSAYNAAKHALNSLTANLRMDLRASHPNINVSLVLPGVVITDFGASALGAPPGSNSANFPNAQPVEEVAAAIAQLIEEPRAEIMTNAVMKDLPLRYYADVEAFEKQMPR
jgi:short-subunit dehydrogenase